MTNLELQAYRRYFMLKVAEASEFVGNTIAEVWHNWEQGNSTIPTYVIETMKDLKNVDKTKLTQLLLILTIVLGVIIFAIF